MHLFNHLISEVILNLVSTVSGSLFIYFLIVSFSSFHKLRGAKWKF